MFKMDPESFVLEIDPEVYMVKEFNAILKRDKSKDKTLAFAELTYVWFYCDCRSDFTQITDLEEREKEIISSLDGIPKGWKPDTLVLAAVEKYMSFRTVAEVLLDDAKETVNNMSRFVKEASKNLFDNDVDISKLQKYVEGIPKLYQSIDELEKKIKSDNSVASKHKGNQTKSMFEDGDDD